MSRAHLRFLQANEPILVGRCVFVVDRDLVWEFLVGPHGDQISKGERRESLERLPGYPKMEDHLPPGWSYEEFMVAWVFWAQGHDAGDAEGSARERERAANARRAA